MPIIIKTFIISTIISLQLFANNIELAQENSQNIYNKEDILVGYYGRPYSKALGVLGVHDIDKLVELMKEKQKSYEEITEKKIVPTFHLIKDIATIEPGWDKDYIKPLNEKIIMDYILRAQKENFAVILDVQLGTMTPLEAVTPIIKFLKYPNVHIALDPEFKIPKHRRYPPGKFVGHIFGNDVNEVQEAMKNYMLENNIAGDRMLLVHMFMDKMLRKKEDVKEFENINLLYNIDGHGRSTSKVKIYNAIYDEEVSKKAQGGFKIFFKNDIKPLMTPIQILGQETVKGTLIWKMPNYINYH